MRTQRDEAKRGLSEACWTTLVTMRQYSVLEHSPPSTRALGTLHSHPPLATLAYHIAYSPYAAHRVSKRWCRRGPPSQKARGPGWAQGPGTHTPPPSPSLACGIPTRPSGWRAGRGGVWSSAHQVLCLLQCISGCVAATACTCGARVSDESAGGTPQNPPPFADTVTDTVCTWRYAAPCCPTPALLWRHTGLHSLTRRRRVMSRKATVSPVTRVAATKCRLWLFLPPTCSCMAWLAAKSRVPQSEYTRSEYTRCKGAA